ncbi:DUF6192 family protein [Nonomuraea sp. NPDC049784]|uniref:DUF6192 family protein n=1 Tax=Nonomuraea sp. NPDC049784 TaxID=3154361 RepID=UPI0033F54A9C
MAEIPDEQERWAALAEPPLHERTGEHRWTQDAAKRRGRASGRPPGYLKRATLTPPVLTFRLEFPGGRDRRGGTRSAW